MGWFGKSGERKLDFEKTYVSYTYPDATGVYGSSKKNAFKYDKVISIGKSEGMSVQLPEVRGVDNVHAYIYRLGRVLWVECASNMGVVFSSRGDRAPDPSTKIKSGDRVELKGPTHLWIGNVEFTINGK